MRKIKKYIAILTLFNVIFLSLLIIPQQKAHAALPIIAGQVLKEAGEKAALKIVRKAGYRVATSPEGKKAVLSMYSRLSPQGKQFYDEAIAMAVKANNVPGWAKVLLPTALVAEIGMIMSGLTSDSANGLPVDYNSEVPAGDTIVITEGMPETWVRDGLAVQAFASFSIVPATGNYTNSYMRESSVLVKSVVLGVGFDQYKITGFKVLHWSSTDANPFMIKVMHTRMKDGQLNYSTFKGTKDQIATLVGMLTDKTVVTFTEKVTGLTADTGAVTGEENATDIETWIPTEDNTQSLEEVHSLTVDNPDYYPEGATVDTPEETVPEPETKPIESEWWKWLTAPLEKILELLKTLFDWLKSTFGQIPEWFSSILSKLADLLGAVGDIFGKLGEWSFVEWWANLFGKLGEMLDTIKLNALDLWNWLGQLLDGILALPETMWTWFWDNLVGSPNDVNMDKLKNTGTFFTTKFPFSLPWDIQRGLEAVFSGVGSDLPTWNYPIMGHTFEIKIPSLFESWGVYIRGFMLIMFDIGLVYSVRKLLGGAS